MKNILIKFFSLFSLFSVGIEANAQEQTFNALFHELQIIKKQLVPDKRLAVLEIEIRDTLNPIIVVSGETDMADAKENILKFFNEKGISFVDSINLLPSTSLGDKIWGLATLSVSNMRSQPDHTSELVSQILMGTPMKILDTKEGWYRVQTPEKYIGWIDAPGLQRFSSKEMANWKNSNRYIFNRISDYVLDSPNRKAVIISDIVYGDMFEAGKKVKGFIKIKIPDGRIGYVRKKDCLSWHNWSNVLPSIRPILSIARQMTGSPYLWGGTSVKAVDCSGLVKMAYFSQAIILARDASQQARYGNPVDFSNLNNLQPGDLLFFGHNVKKIIHVGIYLGNSKYIHASGLVNINSINPIDPDYNVTERKNLVAACRIMNSLNTEGIVMVKDHPWYTSKQ